MDIKVLQDFKEMEEATFIVVNPFTGEETDWKINLRSPDSPQIKRVREKWQKISTKRGQKGLSVDQQQAFYKELCKVATTNWNGLVGEGEPIECDEDTREEWYSHKWLREQVAEFLVETNSFLSRNGS